MILKVRHSVVVCWLAKSNLLYSILFVSVKACVLPQNDNFMSLLIYGAAARGIIAVSWLFAKNVLKVTRAYGASDVASLRIGCPMDRAEMTLPF